MFSYLIVSTAALAFTAAAPTPDSGMYVVPNDTAACARDLVNWCSGMKYPQEGVGLSMISIGTRTRSEGYVRLLCTSDPDGTNCTKNGRQWFACSKENEFTYQGKKLDPEAAPDGLCETAEMAFNDIMVPNLSYDNETVSKALEKGMEGFFREMSDMREMIENMSRRLTHMFDVRPWFPSVWGGDDDDDEDYDERRGEESYQMEREREN